MFHSGDRARGQLGRLRVTRTKPIHLGGQPLVIIESRWLEREAPAKPPLALEPSRDSSHPKSSTGTRKTLLGPDPGGKAVHRVLSQNHGPCLSEVDILGGVLYST